jgi:hypothetical protein
MSSSQIGSGSPSCTRGLYSEHAHVEAIVGDIINKIEKSSIEALKRGGLTDSQLDNIREDVIQIAAEGEKLFGKECDLSDVKIQAFIKKQCTALISSVEEIVRNQPPNLIREAGLSEAVFSHKGDCRPILVTDSLATCIGVAGYDPINQFGFVVHFTIENEIDASGTLPLDHIRRYREQNTNAPLLIHLRGGIKGLSEPLLLKVKEWLASSNFMVIIASEDTLQPSMTSPKCPGSIKLDVQTGTCETYDPTTNLYSQVKKKDVSELDTNFMFNLVA